jgi:hypothetical protein
MAIGHVLSRAPKWVKSQSVNSFLITQHGINTAPSTILNKEPSKTAVLKRATFAFSHVCRKLNVHLKSNQDLLKQMKMQFVITGLKTGCKYSLVTSCRQLVKPRYLL